MSAKQILGSLAIALAIGLAFVALRPTGERATSTATEGVLPVETPGGPTELAGQLGGSSERSRLEGERPLSAGALAIPVGVRLGGPGMLAGRVLEREGGLPVAGARVDLLAYPPAGAPLVARMMRLGRFRPGVVRRTEPVAVARSDEQGYFRLEGVRSGRYFLEARGERHVADHLEQVRVDAAGSGGPVQLYVRRGGRLLGRLIDDEERGLAGASIAVHPGAGTILTRLRTNDLRFRQTTTDHDGRFEVAGLPPGSGWEVAAFGRGIAVTHALGLELRAGEDTEVVLRAGAGATLRGRVLAAPVGEEGAPRPVAGAHLGVLPRGLRDLHFADELLALGGATSDAEGRYVLRDVPLGQVDVVAVAPGFVPGRSALVQAWAGTETQVEDLVLAGGPSVVLEIVDPAGAPVPDVRATWWVADWKGFDFDLSFTPFLMQGVAGFRFPVSDEDGRLEAGPFGAGEQHTIWLEKAGSPNMYVRWSEVEGPEKRVVFSPGGSVDGIVLDAERAEPLESFTVFSPDRTDANDEAPAGFNAFSGGLLFEAAGGRFRVDGLRPGWAELRVEAPGYAPAEARVEVEAGETRRGVILRLERGRGVRGTVVDGEGAGVPGAQVIAVRSDGLAFQDLGSDFRVDTRADRVRQNKDFGLALLGAVSALGVSGPGAVTTDAEGSFTLASIPGEGAFRVEVRHRAYATTRSEELSAGPGEVLEGVEVRLSSGSTLTGSVVDRHGNPVRGAILVATPSESVGQVRGDIETYQGETRGEGRYRIAHMRPGNYLVSSVRGDAALTPMSLFGTLNFDFVQVPPDTVVELDLVDTSAGACRVFGAVTSEIDVVDSGMLFAVGFGAENLLGVDVKVAQVASAGAYEFAGLAPGVYQVTYEGSGRRVRFELDVPDLPELRVDLPFPRGRVAGRVVDADEGQPVMGAEVALTRLEGRLGAGLLEGLLPGEPGRQRVYADANGRFSFERLSAGEFELTARAPRVGGLAAASALRIQLGPDEARLDVVLRLPPALALAGRVLDAAGTPLPGATVRVFSRDARTLELPLQITDEQGCFRFEGLAEGMFELLAEARGYAPSAPRVVELLGGRAEAGGAVDLRLARGARVRVRVLDAHTGVPVVGAAGRLVPLEQEAAAAEPAPEGTGTGSFLELLGGSGRSGADGWLELGRRAAGQYKLEVFRGPRRAERDALALEEGTELELELLLP